MKNKHEIVLVVLLNFTTTQNLRTILNLSQVNELRKELIKEGKVLVCLLPSQLGCLLSLSATTSLSQNSHEMLYLISAVLKGP